MSEDTITRREIYEAIREQHHRTRELIRKELAAITERLNRIEQKENDMSAEIDNLNAKLDGLTSGVSDLNDRLLAATAAISTEIQQLRDAVSGGTANVTAIVAATGRIDTANQGLAAASAALQAQTDSLKADDPTLPTP